MEIAPGIHALRLIGASAVLIAEEELTLVDTGHRGSLRLLLGQLKRIGRSVRDISRIVCTHAHPDHIGGAHEIAHASGAPVYLHPDDESRLRIRFREAFTRPPLPNPILAFLTPLPKHVVPVRDGEVLPPLEGLEVIHTPGHTPGSICLYSPSRRLVIVGDILQRRGDELTLPTYVFTDDMAAARRSIARIAELDVDTIVFAHFPPLRHGARDALRRLAA